MKILAMGDLHGKLPKKIPKNVDLILLTGDMGKADLAKKIYFLKSKKDITASKKEKDAAHEEIYDSTIEILKKLSEKKDVYMIMGNVATNWSKLLKGIKKIKRAHVVKNRLRILNGLRVGFLEFFTDNSWIKEFKEKDKEKIDKARKQTAKAEKVLKRFGNLDILVCHQPPYGVLDKVDSEFAPKSWKRKHAGSRAILNYIKKKQPRFVFCGHIHEGKGMKKIGKTKVYNLGMGGCVVVDVKC